MQKSKCKNVIKNLNKFFNCNKINVIIFCFLILFISSFFIFNLVEAKLFDSGSPAKKYLKLIGEHGYEETSSLGPDVSLKRGIYRILNISLTFVGIIFVILIIYGGFLWMTSQGNDDQVGKARTIIIRSSIGLLIVLASLSIAWFALRSIIDATT
ncbi:MAG: hypothetical protein U9O66_01035 [Patescibacteria group bacterium]|nr:hypothetical protein [Patescibacteria group bacterium]